MPESPPASRFELSGGSLCLDFANTWGDRARPATDRLTGGEDLLGFAVATGLLGAADEARLREEASRRPRQAAEALAAARALRTAIYELFSARAAGTPAPAGALAALNAELAICAAPRLVAAGDGFAWDWGEVPGLRAPLAAVARSAAELLAGADLARVRECGGDGCTWLFLDRSRNRSRRWCSMESCGNRAKARRHYRRHAAG